MPGLAAGETARLLIDDVAVPVAAMREPQKVDPGRHELVVRAGEGSAARELREPAEVQEGETLELTLTLPPLQPGSPTPAVAKARRAEEAAPAPRGMPALATLGFATAITGGLVGLVAGTTAIAKRGQLGGECPNQVCDADSPGAADLNTARSWALAANVSFGVAGAGVVVGIIGLLRGHGATAPPPRARAWLRGSGPARQGCMGASRRAAVFAGLGAAVCALAACDVLLGLNDFSVRDCKVERCDGSVPTEDGPDARDDADAGKPAADGMTDSSPEAADGASDGDASDAPGDGDADGIGDGPPDVAPPTVTEIWVHWPMPNPDAAIAPDSDASLPNPMSYVTDHTALTVYDQVTLLTWEATPAAAATYADAETACLALAQTTSAPWRVPTRIELVSLIDFTRVPTFDVDAFPLPADAAPGAAAGTYWTSSLAPSPAGPAFPPDADPTTSPHWAVSFADGTVATTATRGVSASWVRCVRGGS